METMELLLTIILCVLVTAADGSGPDVISVKEDDDVVLPCSLSSKENLESGLFDWKKDWKEGEKRVFMYDGGRYSGKDFKDQDQQFEGRVSHFPHELKNGNASIKISKTKVSDSGTYSCIFPRLQPRQTFSIQLLVECVLKDRTGEKDSVACRKPSARPIKITNDQALLQCEVHGAFPKPEVEWRDSSGNILPAEDPKFTESGGRYDITLQTFVSKTDNYSCVVTQKEICHQVHYDLLVYPPGAALKPIVTGHQTEDGLMLQCEVYGVSPGVKVELKDSSGEPIPADQPQLTQTGGSYNIILKTNVTKADTYSCEVTSETNKTYRTESYMNPKGPVAESYDSGFSAGWVVTAVVVTFVITLLLVGVVLSVLLATGRIKCKTDEEKGKTIKETESDLLPA